MRPANLEVKTCEKIPQHVDMGPVDTAPAGTRTLSAKITWVTIRLAEIRHARRLGAFNGTDCGFLSRYGSD